MAAARHVQFVIGGDQVLRSAPIGKLAIRRISDSSTIPDRAERPVQTRASSPQNKRLSNVKVGKPNTPSAGCAEIFAQPRLDHWLGNLSSCVGNAGCLATGDSAFACDLRRALLTIMIEHIDKQDRAQDYFALDRKRAHFRPLQPREGEMKSKYQAMSIMACAIENWDYARVWNGA